MAIIIYGDFGCPYSYLASLRADQLLRSRAATLARPGERLPRRPAGPVDVAAAVAAYAESVSDGVPGQLRPNALIHDPDVNRVMRRSGGTVTVHDDPLTTPGTRRVRPWQQEWLALPCPVTPVVIDPDGAVLPRSDALRYLAAAVGVVSPPPPVLPARSAAAGPEDRMASAGAGDGL